MALSAGVEEEGVMPGWSWVLVVRVRAARARDAVRFVRGPVEASGLCCL